MTDHPLATWHRLVRTQDPSGLNALLAEDAVFHSPVVYTPQRGRTLAAAYLSANLVCCSDKAVRELGYVPATLHDMLKDSYCWLQAQGLLK